MKELLFLFLPLLFVGTIVGQRSMAIRDRIIPLQSTRSDVERLTRKIVEPVIGTRYETDAEIIDVTFSSGKCMEHGWNIPADRVLSYRVYPKKDVLLEHALKEVKSIFQFSGDTRTRYDFDPVAGIVLATRLADQNVDSISFYPREADAGLRCKGYPPFSLVSSHYPPFGVFNVENPADWDSHRLVSNMFDMKENDHLNGSVVIYCKRNQLKDCKRLEKEARRVAARVFEDKTRQPTIIIGGYRDKNQIETFLMPKGLPIPVAEPWYPADK